FFIVFIILCRLIVCRGIDCHIRNMKLIVAFVDVDFAWVVREWSDGVTSGRFLAVTKGNATS
ncbi:hypothetical protein, partial [Acinetobacter baumannii]